MEEDIVEEIMRESNVSEKLILLLIKICKDNKKINIKETIKKHI